MTTVLLWILIYILFGVSLVGVVLPVVPDTIPLWGGILLYRFILSPAPLPLMFWIGMVVLSGVIILADYLTGAIFVKRYGGSRLAVIAAIIGIIIGISLLGPVGIIIGPFVTVYIVGLIEKKSSEKALKVAFGTIVGFFSSAVVKLLLQSLMLIWFFLVVY